MEQVVEPLELYAGLDVHSEYTYGTIKDEKGTDVQELRVTTDEEGFGQLFGRFRSESITAVFEASRNWTHIAKLLKKQRVKPVLANPLKTRAIATARIKTDKIDSRILADLLRADLIPRSYMPSDDIVELRQLVRYRAQLGRLSGQLKNKARTIMAREGVKSKKDPFGPRSRPWLESVELGELNRRELDYTVKLLDDVKKEIEKITLCIEKECLAHPDVHLLMSIPGIGKYSGLMILSEIGDVKRFPTADKLASYSGLVSSTHQSGNACYQGKVTKQGSKWLRWILVECALITIRKPSRLQKFYKRIAKKKGHQKAIVATARKMLTIIWHLLNKQETFVP